VIEVLREALEGERAWLVGGALRDRLLGRPTPDLDVVVDGDVRAAARRLGGGVGGAAF
jgi:tRNA nucleotidyltransferase/poly(A) polymerase